MGSGKGCLNEFDLSQQHTNGVLPSVEYSIRSLLLPVLYHDFCCHACATSANWQTAPVPSVPRSWPGVELNGRLVGRTKRFDLCWQQTQSCRGATGLSANSARVAWGPSTRRWTSDSTLPWR